MSTLNECICIKDFEVLAEKQVPHNRIVFLNSGATDEQTLQDNCRALKEWRFQPMCLRDVSRVSLKCELFGDAFNFPIGIAPTGQMKTYSHAGELDAAKAAENLGTVFTESTWSSVTIEDIASAYPKGCQWFQLYILKDRDLTKSLVKRAEKNGAKAIVLTVDCPVPGKRYRFMRVKPMQLYPANLKGVAADWKSLTSNLRDSSTSWKDFDWLKSITRLPIIVKGILTPESALEAVEHGASAIWVSNHGGRQFDGVPASIYALPSVVKTIDKRCPVLFDGGIRNGGDVAKAIALGADYVFVGRPIVWGVAIGGADGAKKVLEILRSELELTMKLLGVTSLRELRSVQSLVVHESNIISKL